jgi:hypothetical protein
MPDPSGLNAIVEMIPFWPLLQRQRHGGDWELAHGAGHESTCLHLFGMVGWSMWSRPGLPVSNTRIILSKPQ